MKIDGGPIHIDNSIMKAVARCSTEAVVRYILDYTSREERAYLRAGDAGHQAIALHFKGHPSLQVLARFKDLYAAWADEHVMPDDRLTHHNTSRVLARYLETHPLSALPYTQRPDLVEIGFGYPLDPWNEFMFVGRMDGIVHSRTHNMPFINEVKFPGRITDHWKKQFRQDSQITGYIWAGQQHTNQTIGGAFINAIEFSRLPSDEKRKCKEHAVPYAECGELHASFDTFSVTRTEQAIEEWHKSALHLAKRYRDLLWRYNDIAALHKVRMQGMFHNACTFCALMDFCATGRQVHLIDNMLIKDPWHPWMLRDQPMMATHRSP